jgi:hypothetical protein
MPYCHIFAKVKIEICLLKFFCYKNLCAYFEMILSLIYNAKIFKTVPNGSVVIVTIAGGASFAVLG